MSDGEKVNILLVDDQPGRLLSYEAILGALGHNIVRANSGAEALQRLMQADFAVILLDVNMPGMDGFETAALIHQHPRYEKTPIIFVTAFHVTDLDRMKGYELGAVDYVYIPVVPQILRSKVAVLIELYSKRRELQRLNENLAHANAELELANSTLQAEKTRELLALNLTLERANTELADTNRSLKSQISERERVEQALRRSEKRLQTILQNTSALIYQIDTEGRFVHVNRMWEELFHLENERVHGRSMFELFPPANAANFDQHNRRVLDEGKPLEFEETLELDDGVHVYNSIKAPLFDEDGRAYGIVGFSTDITERKRLEDALKEADRRKDEFIAMLAHELRNPLAPIVNGLELMRQKALQDPELVWCREVIGRQVKHLTRLVEDLLDVSRITQGKIKLKKEVIELAGVVARAIETSRPLIEAGRHELHVRMPDQVVMVEGDPTRLAQVIANLLSNAAKYTHDGGRLDLQVECSQTSETCSGLVEIRVRDDGVGIPSEMLPKLFELFSQVERTLDRSQGGLGIGLALVKRLVQLHGGDVSAFSDGPGKGSQFVVRLPIVTRASAARPQDARGAEELPVHVLRVPRRILVVDDNADSADSLALILRQSGYVVQTAHNGFDALDVAASFRPQIILLDIGMPGMNGYETAHRVRESTWGRDVLLVAVTGWSQSDVRERTRRAGFNIHLVKPVDIAELGRLLDSLPADASCQPV